MAARRPASPPSAPEPQDVRIVRIGADGDGIAALADGTPLYAPGVLPGEIVRMRALAKRGEGWAAAAEAVLVASAERTAPPCAHFGTCGGCAVQHWQEAPYLAWKAGLLAAALRRAGYQPALSPILATQERSRRRMDLAVRRHGHAVRLGLHLSRGHDVVDLHACHVLHPSLAALLDPLRELLSRLAGFRREGSVVGNLLDGGADLLLRTDAPLDAADRTRIAGFARTHDVLRVAWALGSGSSETAAQLRPAVTTFAGVAVAPPPGAFLQASDAGEAAILAAVLAGLPQGLPARARIAELYAGCGTLTFALAARARIAAFEGDADAAAALTDAANRAGLAGRIAASRRDLVRQPLTAPELAPFAAVVLDPPFAGAAVQVAHIAASKVGRVVYVSCNPAALAHDAAVLRAGGFALLSAVPIDQFRWSARLESVTVFGR